jgi:hypothetical protein
VASLALVLVILLNLVATTFIARSAFDAPIQKVLQLILVWAVSLVGPIIVVAVLKAARPERHFDSDSLGTSWLPGIGPESESAHPHHSGHGGESDDAGHSGDDAFGGH